MSPAKPISNIHATTLLAVLLLIGSAACGRNETRSAAVTTNAPGGTSTAPSANSAASRDEALVRVVHGIPNAPAMDLYAGDLMLFDAVGFKTVSNYRAVDGKRYTFALRPAGMTNAAPLSSNTEGLEDGNYYTVFALPGDDRNARLRIVSDKLDRPAEGKAKLRVVHGGEGAGTIDVHAPGLVEPIVDNLAFQSVSEYADVAPIRGQVEVRMDGSATPLVALPNAQLEAGRFYTMVFVGSSKGSPALEAFIIEDILSAPQTTR
jgi:hypothetical protein